MTERTDEEGAIERSRSDYILRTLACPAPLYSTALPTVVTKEEREECARRVEVVGNEMRVIDRLYIEYNSYPTHAIVGRIHVITDRDW